MAVSRVLMSSLAEAAAIEAMGPTEPLGALVSLEMKSGMLIFVEGV